MFERELEREIKNLDKRGLPIKIVKTIKEFNDILQMVSKPISAGRRYAYVIRLRKIAKMIPKRFLNEHIPLYWRRSEAQLRQRIL